MSHVYAINEIGNPTRLANVLQRAAKWTNMRTLASKVHFYVALISERVIQES